MTMAERDEEFFGAPDIDMTCLGMELFRDEREQMGRPVDVIVVARTLDEDGLGYHILTTPELEVMHAVAMLRFAQIRLEEAFRWRSGE